MSGWLASLGSQSVPLFWEPLLGWTAVASLGLLAVSPFRSMHPLYGYRVRQALLFSLPVSLLAAPFVGIGGASTPITRIPAALPAALHAAGVPGRAVFDGLRPAADVGPLVFGGLLVGWAAISLVGLVAFWARFVDLRRLGASLSPCRDPALLDLVGSLQDRFGIGRRLAVHIGPKGSVPMTFGWRRPVIAVPPELLGAGRRFEMAVAHELIHVRRGDFVWGMLERAIQRTFTLHPLVWVLGQSIDRFREASCDHEVVTSLQADPKAYGELLLSLSSRPIPLLAAGMARSTSKLKHRIEIMTRFIDVPKSAARSSKSAVAAALVAGVMGFGAACASGEAETPEPTAAELTAEFPSIADGDREDVLRRLEVQVEYLRERVAALSDTIDATPDGMRNRRYHDLIQQVSILQGMRMGRLEALETLRLEVETERRISGL